jgi:hypothetical protein
MKAADAFRSGRAGTWTPERLSQLSMQDIRQLRDNAARLEEAALVARCDQALAQCSGKARSRSGSKGRGATRAKRLVARRRAFEARGVWVQDARSSWGGLRTSDGAVVLALWADAIETENGGCRYLLWAPNVGGSRPWSDQPGGRERLEHCQRALKLGVAEGLLVYGERCAGHIPEDKAYTVLGVDPETVLRFAVEKRGEEYWATWGRKAPSSNERS